MTEETHEKLKEIKQSFRLLMNGVASHSMRQKGVEYKINWGVPVPELQQMAVEYGKDYDHLVDVWMERVRTQEMAELLAFHLLQHLRFAPSLAYQWIASDKDMYQLCGYQLLARLFAQGLEPNERGINEFLDQAHVTLQGDNLPLKHAAYNCVLSFCELGEELETVAKRALNDLDLL